MSEYLDHDFRAYFRSPRAGLRLSLVKRLTAFINATHTTLDCAIYDLRHPDILAALKGVVERGVKLRLLYDAGPSQPAAGPDPKPDGTAQAIAAAGLSGQAIAFAEHGHLMHNKFLIRDGEAVWMGSANFTVGGLELQDNSCLELRSNALAAQYAAAFDHLLAAAKGASFVAAPAGSDGAVAISGETVKAAFSPGAGEGVEDRLVAVLDKANEVKVAAFLISDPGILQALARFQPSAMPIEGVIDPNGMADAMRSKTTPPELWWFMADPRFVHAPSHAFPKASRTSCTTSSSSSTTRRSSAALTTSPKTPRPTQRTSSRSAQLCSLRLTPTTSTLSTPDILRAAQRRPKNSRTKRSSDGQAICHDHDHARRRDPGRSYPWL
jgi:hypothetical protein